MINFIAQDQKWDFRQVFHGEEGVQLCFGLRETFQVFCVNKEDNAAHFGEVVSPETTSWRLWIQGLVEKEAESIVASNWLERLTLLMAPKVEGSKFDVADGKLFRSWMGLLS